MENNWYTQKEVAELLGISKATVYHYAKQGKIKKIPDPHRIHRFARYEKEEVDKLAQERKEAPEGLRPSEVAKELGLTVQSVLKHIRSGNIKATQVPFGDERTYYVISPEDYEKAKEKLAPNSTNRIRKSEYYEAHGDIALFQLFASNEDTARITKKDDEWGFYLLKEKKWIPYESGVSNYGFKPMYSIHQELIEPKGYVHFEIPFGEDLLYPFIDYLYQTWGVENVRLREQEASIYIYVKAEKRLLPDDSFQVHELLPFVIEGIVHIVDQLLILESTYRKTTFELPMKMLDKVKKLAEQDHISMSQWVEQVIEQYLAANQQDKYKL